MSNFSYDDFAVLVRKFNPEMLSPESLKSLRIVPLSDAPSMAKAISGTDIAGLDSALNLPREKNGTVVLSNVEVQHNSDGYCRLVGHVVKAVIPQEGQGVPVTTAKAFVLYRTVQGESEGTFKKEVIAVASLKEGFAIGDVCYPSFTITTVNNYQSVAFNPNAFATVEDLKNINGLDGLHIAFDHASGDIKLLDGKGNVLDRANLHMDADTIIADGEEGYKYVKTDVQQDIHAEKDFMLPGKTAGVPVYAEYYAPKTACFLVEVADDTHSIASARSAVSQAEDALKSASEQGGTAKAEAEANLAQAKSDLAALELAAVEPLSIESIRKGDSSAIKGIRVYTENGGTRSSVDYTLSGEYTLITGQKGQFLKEGSLTVGDSKAIIEVYSPDAFVWTVGEEPKEGAGDNSTFAQKMNAAAASMGFHVGDDIPLGTNIATLIGESVGNMSASGGFDAEKYMHEGTDSEYIDELIDAQRNLAKEELVAWNAQHPALAHDGWSGTRISSDGVDIRHGKIEIGNGIDNKGENEDNVKRYVIETDIDDYRDGARAYKGLQIGVIDSVQKGSNGMEPIQKDILTISAEGYISGAPTCLALLKCSKSGDPATVSANLTDGRITANFTAEGTEDASNGVFTLTITDSRANNGFGYAPRIVEIIPVYKSGADASEAVPAQRSISAIASAVPDKETGKSTLSIMCSQVIDWAQSIDLGGTSGSQDMPTGNGMELYLIVKVY